MPRIHIRLVLRLREKQAAAKRKRGASDLCNEARMEHFIAPIGRNGTCVQTTEFFELRLFLWPRFSTTDSATEPLLRNQDRCDR